MKITEPCLDSAWLQYVSVRDPPGSYPSRLPESNSFQKAPAATGWEYFKSTALVGSLATSVSASTDPRRCLENTVP